MNKVILTSFFSALTILAFASDTYAQTRNPRGGNSSRSGSARQGGGGNTTRQAPARTSQTRQAPTRTTQTRQAPTRTSQTRQAPTRTTQTRPVQTRPVQTRPAPTRPRVGTSIPAGRVYNPTHVNRNAYGTRNYYSPYNYRATTYSPYRHNPVRNILRNINRFQRTSNYYSYVNSYNRNYIYRNWIMFPSTYGVGYQVYNNYPYFVYGGYQHRYSAVDYCDYQLVDKYTDQVVSTYYNQTCNYGYDSCSMRRDQLNQNEYDDRYFCAETYNNGYGY